MPRIRKRFKTNRLTLELPEPIRNRLEEMRDETMADTLSEVVRRALQLFDFVTTCSQQGAHVLVRNEKGQETDLLILGISSADHISKK